MRVTKWLSIFSLVALVNLGLVSASVIHRLAVGSETSELRSEAAAVRQTESIGKSIDDHATGSSAAELLQHIEAPQLNVNPQPVDDDDPLMAEILKHSALQFPSAPADGIDSPAVLEKDWDANIHVSKARLAAVRDLGVAAAALVDLAEQLQSSGNADESHSAMVQAEQLQQMMIQLLK